MAPIVAKFVLAVSLLPILGDGLPPAWDRVAASAGSEFQAGHFEAARALSQSGFSRWQKDPGSEWHWEFRFRLAESLLELDRLSEARPLLAPAPPRGRWEGRRQASLAFLHYRTQDYTGAARYVESASTLVRDQPDLSARVELISGMLHLKQERYSDAEASFKHVTQSLKGSGSLLEFYALINLGHLYLLEFRYDPALQMFETARTIATRLGMARAEAMAAGNLGVVQLWLGDRELALQQLGDAVRISKTISDPSYQQAWLAMLGEARQAMGDFEGAEKSYEEARALARPGVDDDWLSSILASLTGIALELGDMPKAEQLNTQSSELATRLGGNRALIWPKLNSALIDTAKGNTSLAQNEFREAIRISKAAGDPIGEWRSRSGLAAAQRKAGDWAEADQSYRSAIETIERERSKIARDSFKLTFLSSLIRFYQEYVDFLVERGQMSRAFEVAVSSRARVLAERLQLTETSATGSSPLQLRRLLSDGDSTLAFYWVAPKRSFVWVLNDNGLRCVELPRESEIRKRVSAWTASILDGERPEKQQLEAGQWLFSKLLPSEVRSPNGSTLVIVPDGSLFDLNFETLPSGENRYWIEDTEIRIAQAPSLLHKPHGKIAERLLLVGDPSFQSEQFPKLAYLKSEMQQVSAVFASKDVFSGDQASPAVYQRASREPYSKIHFAAHAVANRESPLDSAIVLSGKESDHKLYARDIMTSRVHADLVTLSACQTAGKRTYAGEGLTGLAWAFLSAGANHVVAGLWDVDDRATARLMSDFYDGMHRGLLPPAALRSAKLELMKSSPVYRKPIYWAAFQTFTNTIPAKQTRRK